MKNKEGKAKDVVGEGSALLTESLLDVGADIAADIFKESITHVAGELAIDTLSSFIPGVSGAVSSYKRKRAEKNIIAFVEHLHSKREILLENLHNKTEENRVKIDEMMHHIFENVTSESQEEKIEYMANGFFRLSEHENFTEDFVLLYYDILKQLRMVDISVLKMHYHNLFVTYADSNFVPLSYQDIMTKHDLSYEQYLSVRQNLARIGLLEVQVEDSIEDDLNALMKSIIDLQENHDKVLAGKKTKKVRKPKLKLKEREKLKLNKFGREFYKFFGEIEES